jgi:hypothetical protein
VAVGSAVGTWASANAGSRAISSRGRGRFHGTLRRGSSSPCACACVPPMNGHHTCKRRASTPRFPASPGHRPHGAPHDRLRPDAPTLPPRPRR